MRVYIDESDFQSNNNTNSEYTIPPLNPLIKMSTLGRVNFKLIYSIHQSTQSETKWLNEVIKSIPSSSQQSTHFNQFLHSNHRHSTFKFSLKSTSSQCVRTARSSFKSSSYDSIEPSTLWPDKKALFHRSSSKLNCYLNCKRTFSQQASHKSADILDDETSELDLKSNRRIDKFTKSTRTTTPFKSSLKSPSKSIHHKFKNRMKEFQHYNDAIATLNSLQSNRIEIQNRILNPETLAAKVRRSRDQLFYLGVSRDDLKSMNVVHISGTKGKGSTCAFIESILRKKGFKTGLFTSPHLISVRERIQLDGKPIEKDLFARNFFHVYNRLQTYEDEQKTSDNEVGSTNSMPFYFNFLTLMALYTFKQQGCDATILEVGIGGEFDCTNIVEQPVVVGVSSLGIDHVKLLGNTIEEIAWHKSGIFKPNVHAFTSDNQRIEALSVLIERAIERRSVLRVCPPLDEYPFEEGRKIKLGINGDVQKLNASLALQICNHFLNKKLTGHRENEMNNRTYADPFHLDNEYLDAIEECKWRGRFEVLRLKNKSTFYLDGAHTVESLKYCIDWFRTECSTLNDQTTRGKLFKILIFNCTGYRDYVQLLNPLLSGEKFDMICFTTNLKKVEDLNNTKSDLFYAAEDASNRDEFKESVLQSLNFTGSVKHFDCLENCLKSIHKKNEENLLNNLQTKVLVSGSIHLVGGVISLLNEFYC